MIGHAFCPHCGYDLALDEPIAIGEARFDPFAGFTYRGTPVRLDPQRRILLHSLMKAKGCWIARPTLYERLGIEDSADPDNVLRTHTSVLRKRLREVGADRHVDVAYGLGIRWSAIPATAALARVA